MPKPKSSSRTRNPISIRMSPSVSERFDAIKRANIDLGASEVVEKAIEIASASPDDFERSPKMVRISPKHIDMLDGKSASAGVSRKDIIDHGLVKLSKRRK